MFRVDRKQFTDKMDKMDQSEESLLQNMALGSSSGETYGSTSTPRKAPKSDSDDNQPSDNRSSRLDVVKGYTFLMSFCVCCVVAALSTQTATSKSNIFLLVTLRDAVKYVIAFAVVTGSGGTLALPQKDLWILLVSLLANILYTISYNFGMSFMPVGNFEALFSAFYILVTAGVDIVMKHIRKQTIVVSFIAVLGVLLITQPWKASKVVQNSEALCDYLDGVNFSSMNDLGTNQTKNASTVHAKNAPMSSQLFGYSLTIVAATCLTVCNNLNRHLYLNKWNIWCVLFWQGLAGCFVCHLLVVTMTSVTGENHYTLPEGGYCLLFNLLFSVVSSLGGLLMNQTAKYLVVSEISLGNALVTLVLYIIQRTVFSTFNGGNANAVEIVGIVLIILSILSTIIRLSVEHFVN